VKTFLEQPSRYYNNWKIFIAFIHFFLPLFTLAYRPYPSESQFKELSEINPEKIDDGLEVQGMFMWFIVLGEW